jgi:hypothetical protein
MLPQPTLYNGGARLWACGKILYHPRQLLSRLEERCRRLGTAASRSLKKSSGSCSLTRLQPAPLITKQKGVAKPPFSMKYGIVSGSWGDALACLADFRQKVGVGGAICTSLDGAIHRFVANQPFIYATRSSSLERIAVRGWYNDWYRPFVTGVVSLECELDYSDVVFTGVEGCLVKDVPVSSDIVLGNAEVEAASRLTAGMRRFIHVHPTSLNSTSIEHHSPLWPSVWPLLESLGETYVTTGASPVRQGGVDLGGLTDSAAECFALSQSAALTITTSNSVAVWCCMQELPCVVLANKKVSLPSNFWNRMFMTAPNCNLVSYDSGSGRAVEAVLEALGYG